MAKAADLELLKHLAAKGAIGGALATTTSDIAKALGASQQSASRRVRALADEGMIAAEPSTRGLRITVTSGGRALLQRHLTELKHAMDSTVLRTLNGTVESGVGEGRYYVMQPQYNLQFKSLLKGMVYPGTLNLRVSGPELQEFLVGAEPSMVEGFKTKERTFGSLKCFMVSINGSQSGALVLPERTTHKETAELIAPIYLRRKFSLKDGSSVVVTMQNAKIPRGD